MIDNETNINEEAFNVNNNTLIEKKFFYKISNLTLGPFDYSDSKIKVFLNDVTKFKINFAFRNFIPKVNSLNYECNLWTIIQNFNFDSRGHFTVTAEIDNDPCYWNKDRNEDKYMKKYPKDSFFKEFINKLLWIHVIVFILAFYSLYLNIHSILKFAEMYKKIHRRKQNIKDVKIILINYPIGFFN